MTIISKRYERVEGRLILFIIASDECRLLGFPKQASVLGRSKYRYRHADDISRVSLAKMR